ncbi:MAG: DUF3108 domain-containing protein [Pseudomonadota bacterium]
MIRLTLLLAAILASSFARPELPELSPVTAHYKVTVNGIPAGTAAAIEVRNVTGNRQEVAFNVQNRFFRHHEVSRFDWHGCRLTPLDYLHEFSGLGIDRGSAITFDHARSMAVETRGKRRQEIPLTAATSDSLNMSMLARCRMRDGERSFTLPVIYRGERKDMQFSQTGTERLETPAGIFDSVIMERIYPNGGKRTRIWIAPSLDWFMVRFEHVESPVARGSMMLTGISVNGKQLPAPTISTRPGKRNP